MKRMINCVLCASVVLFLLCASARAGLVDNGDGTVSDTSTGLMWQKATASGTYTWKQALAYCENLSLAGHHDWRLPDRNELQSLVDYSRYNPSINTAYFPDTVASYYWSSTTNAYYTGYAWIVRFNFGIVLEYNKTSYYYVRAVRSGQYVLLGDLGSLCIEDYHCDEGDACVEGVCEPIPDDPPALTSGPFVAAGAWPVLSASVENPTFFNQNYTVLWTFSDDFSSCSGDCTHAAEYSVAGSGTWQSLSVSSDAANGYAWVELPIEQLQNATTYAFRFTVTDCASQSTQSGEYYFRVATSDAPPAITGGPWLAAGTWPALPTSASKAFVLDQDYAVLWTFSDDYASCAGLCTHRARYRRVGDTAWATIPVSTDPEGIWYAYAELPVAGLDAGTYQLRLDVRDCAGQRTYSTYYHYFKVQAIN